MGVVSHDGRIRTGEPDRDLHMEVNMVNKLEVRSDTRDADRWAAAARISGGPLGEIHIDIGKRTLTYTSRRRLASRHATRGDHPGARQLQVGQNVVGSDISQAVRSATAADRADTNENMYK